MKTLVNFFFAVLFFTASTVSAQTQKSVFEKASFSTYQNGAACVQLNWKKGSENTAYYLVERSSDGINFRQIALVFTGEDPKLCDYKFRDQSFASAGTTAYYRIALVSNQNELTYLEVKKLELPFTSLLSPNNSDLAGK